MARLRSVKPADAIKVFEQLGFSVARRKGSHISMTKDGCKRPLVIPDGKEIAIGTLSSNLRTAGITADEFEKLLNAI